MGMTKSRNALSGSELSSTQNFMANAVALTDGGNKKAD